MNILRKILSDFMSGNLQEFIKEYFEAKFSRKKDKIYQQKIIDASPE